MKPSSFKFILFYTFSVIQSTSTVLFGTNKNVIDVLQNLYIEYENTEQEKFTYFIELQTIGKHFSQPTGIVDIKDKILPILNSFERRIGKEYKIPKSNFKEDLSIIGTQIFELLENGILLKEIVNHNKQKDPEFKKLSKNGKDTLNRCLLTKELLKQLCGEEENVAEKLPVFLHDFMIHNFSLLEMNSDLLTEINNDIDELFRSLKKSYEALYKYIGFNNEKSLENIGLMTNSSKIMDAGRYVYGWASWAANKALFRASAEITKDLLNKEKLNGLEKELFKEYTEKVHPIICKLLSSLLISFMVEIDRNNGNIEYYAKENYFQTYGSINIISYISLLIFDIKGIARNQNTKYGKTPLNDTLAFIISDTSLEIILNEMNRSLEKNPNITKTELAKNIIEKHRSEIKNPAKLIEEKKSTLDILYNINLSILTYIFDVEKKITEEDIELLLKNDRNDTNDRNNRNDISSDQIGHKTTHKINHKIIYEINSILGVLKGDVNTPFYTQLSSILEGFTNENMEKLIAKHIEEEKRKSQSSYWPLVLGVLALLIIDIIICAMLITKQIY